MVINAYDKLLTKGPESALPTIEDGKLRFTTDTSRLFIDDNSKRIEITDFVKGLTESEIRGLLAPLSNKIYISSDTDKLLYYSVSGNWTIISDYDNIIGNLSSLTTTNKSSIVSSINEVNSNKQSITDSSLRTQDKTVPGAINELDIKITNIEEILPSIDTGLYGFIEHCDILSSTQRIEYTGMNKTFAPLTVNKSTGSYSLGDWSSFPIIANNKPYMVNPDGTIDYQLDENDYTKKLDGTASDIANESYNGGAFSWIQKIYKKEYMIDNDRYVFFSFEKKKWI